MSQRSCAKCERLESLLDEQKTKIQLLETRLMDVLRAYKVIAKQKEDLIAINSAIGNADVDSGQQKRIAELEESALHMSAICGKFEIEREQSKRQIEQLQAECDNLRTQLEKIGKDVSEPNIISNVVKTVQSKKSSRDNLLLFRHKSSQTIEPWPQSIAKHDKGIQAEDSFLSLSSSSQTKIPGPTKFETTAIVAPIRSTIEKPYEHHDESCDDALHNDFANLRSDDHESGSMLDRISPSVSEDDDEDYCLERSASSAEEHHPHHHSHPPHHHHHRRLSSSSSSTITASGASLFYVNELARKEMELAEAKLRVREYECSMRELQWKYSNDKYRYQSRIADLELLNNNFMSSTKGGTSATSAIQSSSSSSSSSELKTVNVAYIRNVLTKLLDTKDKEQKQIMIKALLTALNSF